jgi:hypothetical protein
MANWVWRKLGSDELKTVNGLIRTARKPNKYHCRPCKVPRYGEGVILGTHSLYAHVLLKEGGVVQPPWDKIFIRFRGQSLDMAIAPQGSKIEL